MANQKDLNFLELCTENKNIKTWNAWKQNVEALDAKDVRRINDKLLRKVNLSGADLSGADLDRADLRGANLSEADLSRANLSDADLNHADLRGANLSDANLSDADLNHANLSDADLIEANLLKAYLSGANLSDADLSRANLSDADLNHADLRGADLRGADLRGANLRVAVLLGTDLLGANLSEADLLGTDLRGANLSEADLRGADLTGVDLSGADLSRADLTGANLLRAKLKDVIFSNAIMDEKTRKYVENYSYSSQSTSTVSKEAQQALLQEEIKKINEEKERLQNELTQQTQKKENESQEQVEKIKKELEQKDLELEKITKQKELESEKLQAEIDRIKQGQKSIKEKIKAVFSFLDTTYKQVDKEITLHNRLWWLYIILSIMFIVGGFSLYFYDKLFFLSVPSIEFESEILVFIGKVMPSLFLLSMFATFLTQANRTRKIIINLKEKKQNLEILKGLFNVYNELSEDSDKTLAFFKERIAAVIELFDFYKKNSSADVAGIKEQLDDTKVENLLSDILKSINDLKGFGK